MLRRYAPRNALLKHTRRPTPLGPLEERIPKAESSMVAAAISQNLLLEYSN
ncbi:MAG: hypothetical protein GTN73_06710 [Candidatus Aminicenantes bacterium]|nr:hypothetical protein [Candidatus Aminicenantes bacterium]